MAPPLLEPLARFTAEPIRADLDGEDRLRLFTTMADWSSALLAGMGHPHYARFIEALAPFDQNGPAQIAGTKGRHPVETAAAANAAISHLWEVDDAHRQSTSHPGITVIPAVIALAQAMPVKSDRIRGAIIAGFEAIIRIGSYLGSPHYSVCHTTATAGTFGAAAAAAHLLELDAIRTLWAFGHAGTQAQGLWQLLDDDAAEAKGFHAAIAVRNGIAAAMMARSGIKGAAHILEGKRGMLAAWHLQGGDPHWLDAVDGRMIHTVTVKNWPTCGQMHSALDCAAELQAAAAYHLRDITGVEVEVPKACTDIAGVTSPKTIPAAKFSTTFCVAALLAGHRPDFRGLVPPLLKNPEVNALCAKTVLRVVPEFSARFPAERPARVTIQLADGRILKAERSFRKGDPELPWDRQGMRERTRDVLTLSGRQIDHDALLNWCEDFADPANSRWNVSELFTLFAKESPAA